MKVIVLSLLAVQVFSHTFGEDAETMGERLFNDIRFSQAFFDFAKGDVNKEVTVNFQMFSCASCHMIDQRLDDLGMRGYNDFSARTQVPFREDDTTKMTLRNTPTLIGIGSKYAQNRFSHYDGELADHSDTVLGNFAGRNMGWLGPDRRSALSNITNIIRNDSGEGELAGEFGGKSYRDAWSDLGVDVSFLSDEEIIEKVIVYVTEYMNGIDFQTDEMGEYNGSAYDEFLRLNDLPIAPESDEDIFSYTRRLIKSISQLSLKKPKFVPARYLETHKDWSEFGELEWKGLKVFTNVSASSRGMCIVCHTPPLFTDQLFHNVGVTQFEYDEVHGHGAFETLYVPGLHERGEQKFLGHIDPYNKNAVDLGVWNFFAQPDKPELTHYLMETFCDGGTRCSESELLSFLVGRVKTPTLRNLGHSAPYFHNGSAETLGDVIHVYNKASQFAKRRFLRNGAPQLRGINLTAEDKLALVAFLKSLNEDYE